MGFIDSIKDAFSGDHDDESTPSSTPSAASASDAGARHVDRDAPAESDYGPQVTGGKHRA